MEREQLLVLLEKYDSLFPDNEPLGRTSVIKQDIITKGPLYARNFAVCLWQPIVIKEVHNLLNSGIIRHSASPWSSPVVLIRKKDGNWRFCIDFRQVNAVTHKDAYPLPKIEETLDTLSGAKYFSTLDMASGYRQVDLENWKKQLFQPL